MWNQAWPSLEISNLKRSLFELKSIVELQDPSDPASAELARFLVVRTCGYLEQCVEICWISYLKSRADPRSASFGASWLGRGSNPSPGALVTVVRRFDPQWAEYLDQLMNEDDEYLKRETAFLVDRRNKISHGRSENVGKRKSLDLVANAITVADWFIERFDPR